MQLTKHWAAQLDDYVIDLGWSPAGTELAAVSAAGPVSLFAAKDGARQHLLPGHTDGANALAWHPTQPLLATGGQDGNVKFWDTASGQHTATTPLPGGWVEHLAWRPVSQRPEAGGQSPVQADPQPDFPSELASGLRPLASGSVLAAAAGRSLVLLNGDGAVRHTFKPAPKTLSAIAWQPAGGCLASAYFGGVCLWDADDYVAQKEFPYANGIHALVWSHDNRWLVSGNQDPSVHLWLPEEDQEFHMSGYEGKVKELSFDQSSRWLATGGGRDACLWDCTGAGPEGREPLMFPHDAKVCAVAFQHRHGVLATASADGVLMLWSPERKQPLRATVRMPAAATKLVWSPDDRLLAVGSEKGIVYVLRCEA